MATSLFVSFPRTTASRLRLPQLLLSLVVIVTVVHRDDVIVSGFTMCKAPFKASTSSFGSSLAALPQVVVTQDAITTTTATTTSSTISRHDFWGQDRSVEEIQTHLTSAHLNIAREHVQVLSASPPVVVIHNLLTSDQCHVIMNGAINQQLQRSTTIIIEAEDVNNNNKENINDTKNNNDDATTTSTLPLTSNIRTSSTVWLRDDDDDHEEDDIGDIHHSSTFAKAGGSDANNNAVGISSLSHTLRQMADYVSHMSGLPPHYMENLQVVRYLPGQEFQVHTDHLDSFNDMERRGRLATCLFYLQSPTRGGATHFPEVNVQVVPTQGSALFFWNTVEKPGCPDYQENMFLHADERVRHAGLPVMEGEKWICNRWVHPVDYGAGVRGL